MSGGRPRAGRFRALFDLSPLPTVQCRADGTVELWNAAAERAFGWEAEAARGRRLPEFAPGQEERAEAVAAALRRGEALRQVATVVRHRDGTPRPVEISTAPLHDEQGALVGALVVHAEAAAGPGPAFASLVQHSFDAVLVFGPDRRCTYLSPSAERVLGWRPADLVGTDLVFPVPTEDQASVLAAVAAAGPDRPSRLTHRFLRPDGTRVWVETVMTDLSDDPAVGGLTWNVRDVTEQVRTEQALRAERERYRSVVQHVGQAVFEIDAAGRWSFLNGGWRQLTGLDPAETTGTPVLDLVHPDDRRETSDVFDRLVRREIATFVHEARVMTVSGERWMEGRGGVVVNQGRVDRLAGILADITTRKREEERLTDLALQDPLTKLANRTLLIDRLEHALARSDRNGMPLGVLFVDLDRFKEVNDAYGHDVGDDVLVAVGQRLRLALRASETVGRYGGDEFVVISEGLADESAARAVARRVRAALAEPFVVQDRTHRIGASVGVAMAWPGANEGAAAMIKQADLDMYRAKGRRVG